MTKEQEQYIKDNYTTTARQEMARVIGCSKTIVDRFMQKNDLHAKLPKQKPISSFPEYVEYIQNNYKTKTAREIANTLGYGEDTTREYIAIHHSVEDEAMKCLRKDLKNYYKYIRNLFNCNKVVVGRVVNANFKELMALARLKKEGLIQLQREDTGRYTVILN